MAQESPSGAVCANSHINTKLFVPISGIKFVPISDIYLSQLVKKYLCLFVLKIFVLICVKDIRAY